MFHVDVSRPFRGHCILSKFNAGLVVFEDYDGCLEADPDAREDVPDP